MVRPVVTGLGFAHPPSASQDELWHGFFADHFGQSRVARRIFTRSGVLRRHGVANPVVDDVSRWTTEQRMRRYLVEALPLGKSAVTAALDEARLSPRDVGMFAVASCTGYSTPGLDILLARDLDMPADVQRLFVGHMGCYAALPALGAVSDYVVARGKPAVLLCLELTTLHIQPPTDDLEQVVAHALFSDAAAAVVVMPDAARGHVVQDVAAVTDPSTSDYMTWDVTDTGFRMGLSPRVADVLSDHLRPMVTQLLARNDLTLSNVDGWVVHPGGPRILDVTARDLELPPGALAASEATLREHGNCSSATVLLVLAELLRQPPGGTPPRQLALLAFGPGLTLYATLLRAVP